MAKSSADDEKLRKLCEEAIDGGWGSKQEILLSISVTKSPGIWRKSRRLSAHTAKPRVLVLTTRKVSTIAKFYYQANESYEQACVHISSVIYRTFEKLFQFAQKIEDLMYTSPADEIPFHTGLSKMDLRKTVKSSLSGLDRSIVSMSRRLQKSLTSEELNPPLWDKCKAYKYEAFTQLVAKVYPNETITSVAEISDHLALVNMVSFFQHSITVEASPVITLLQGRMNGSTTHIRDCVKDIRRLNGSTQIVPG
ncbi:Exocyst complex component SEC3A [Acorus gramineus]|uniref:Exocyst complex component SEC3A n=1 Tax=Acorus gramineus TaxID=55184 RepID=A0AAV9B0G3_ACOGR|nr:Exocyst complex component SEC3A [Acorus gramineus]